MSAIACSIPDASVNTYVRATGCMPVPVPVWLLLGRCCLLPRDHNQMGNVMEATVQCVEEAIVNALCAAESTVGRDGNTAFALPHERLREIMAKYNRLV